MSKTVYLVVAAILLCTGPALAKGPFDDVPTDHWAYDTISQLQQAGVIAGQPPRLKPGDKVVMNRYEFALGVAKSLPFRGVGSSTLSKEEKAAVRKLVDEFQDEVAALGVDVDALKRDLAPPLVWNGGKRLRFTPLTNPPTRGGGVSVPVGGGERRTTEPRKAPASSPGARSDLRRILYPHSMFMDPASSSISRSEDSPSSAQPWLRFQSP